MSEHNRLPVIEDCWNRIGVWGNTRPRCSRLEQFVHCQRCTVYGDAAALLRDRSPPLDYPEIWRQHYAAAIPPRATARDATATLVFRLGNEWLALPPGVVDEIIEPVAVHRLTRETPGPIRGLASVHGRLRPCLDLGAMLELETASGEASRDRGCYPRMVVIRRKETVFVFAVDEVLGLHRWGPNDLSPLPGTLSRALKRFSRGVLNCGEKRVGLLDDGQLFHGLTGKPHA